MEFLRPSSVIPGDIFPLGINTFLLSTHLCTSCSQDLHLQHVAGVALMGTRCRGDGETGGTGTPGDDAQALSCAMPALGRVSIGPCFHPARLKWHLHYKFFRSLEGASKFALELTCRICSVLQVYLILLMSNPMGSWAVHNYFLASLFLIYPILLGLSARVWVFLQSFLSHPSSCCLLSRLCSS